MNIWLLLAVLGGVSYATRSVVPLVAGERDLPERVERWSRLLAPGVIAAMLVLTVRSGLLAAAGPAETVPRLVAIAVAVAAAAAGRGAAVVLGLGVGAHLLVTSVVRLAG